MIDWPSALVNEMARRRCVLFLGAGVSSSSTTEEGVSPCGWGEFIDGAINLISDDIDKQSARDFLDNSNYLLSLQAVSDSVDQAEYHKFINEKFHAPRFMPSKLHETIHALDSKIVVTTNFDKIYERYCDQEGGQGYKVVRYYEDSIIDELRSDTFLIIKAHGCIDNLSQIIFTKSQYNQAKYKYSCFYEVLKSIFLTNTVIFVGCSMNDPDVLLLLEDVKNVGRSSKPHYIVTKDGQSKFLKNDWISTYNIRTLEYEGPGHENLTLELQRFCYLVVEKRMELSL